MGDAGAESDPLSGLERLRGLMDRGLLTPAEFEEAKVRLLRPQPGPAPEQLREEADPRQGPPTLPDAALARSPEPSRQRAGVPERPPPDAPAAQVLGWWARAGHGTRVAGLGTLIAVIALAVAIPLLAHSSGASGVTIVISLTRTDTSLGGGVPKFLCVAQDYSGDYLDVRTERGLVTSLSLSPSRVDFAPNGVTTDFGDPMGTCSYTVSVSSAAPRAGYYEAQGWFTNGYGQRTSTNWTRIPFQQLLSSSYRWSLAWGPDAYTLSTS